MKNNYPTIPQIIITDYQTLFLFLSAMILIAGEFFYIISIEWHLPLLSLAIICLVISISYWKYKTTKNIFILNNTTNGKVINISPLPKIPGFIIRYEYKKNDETLMGYMSLVPNSKTKKLTPGTPITIFFNNKCKPSIIKEAYE